ncbi:universal stress protein [Sphingomicrobium astaxanthinifaciens]|uniref:universal stress protein n=1 Tax=Sphingomicrobium astaxanthinifaciens TaxID=1227949 RepID=UPI001FCC9786|nr:universal stress protein [Sphingomicrobium astaxanthinifaciens]MCJ7420716.1 universal stress protein [Sphingomicrobium astaxanthinifaciens]
MKLLACLDASLYANSVTDHAGWIAKALGGSIELLHVIQRRDVVTKRHDLSGALGLGARSALMKELVSIEETQSRLAKAQADALLDTARARLAEQGVSKVTLLERHGDLVETVIEREAEADMVVIGKRGAGADFARGHLGSKIERVVRQSDKPVLVASRAFSPIDTALIAFDGGLTSRKAVAMAATSPLFEGVKAYVVMVGHDDAKGASALDWACETLGERLGGCERVHGDVEGALVAEAERIGADILLMGAYGHGPLRTMIVGSTTTAMMRALTKPMLLFR